MCINDDKPKSSSAKDKNDGSVERTEEMPPTTPAPHTEFHFNIRNTTPGADVTRVLSFSLFVNATIQDLIDSINKELPDNTGTLTLTYQKSDGKSVKLHTLDPSLLLMTVGFDSKLYNRNSIELYIIDKDSKCSKEDDMQLGASASPSDDTMNSWCDADVSSKKKIDLDKSCTIQCHRNTDHWFVGLVNQAMTCYLNSLLQTLYMTPEFRNALYRWEFKGSKEEASKSIPYQLQRLFLQLQTTNRSAVETTNLTKSFGWDSSEAWQQHDIQELCRVMFDALEQCFKNTDQADLISNLYEGKMKDYVKCLVCSKENAREDTFLDVPLSIRPFGSNTAYNSLEEAMRAFVEPELLTENNQYECSNCASLCDAHKGLKFTRFPYLLTCHLKRFDFDYRTFHRIKLNDKVTFPTDLDLSSFIGETKENEGKGEAESSTPEKPDDSSTADSGSALDVEESSFDIASSLPQNDPDIQDEDEGIDVSSSFNEKSKVVAGRYVYELFSIMIHSGSASGGHYYVYIKDFNSGEWFCFNDQNVTKITFDDIRRTYGGGSGHYYSNWSSSSANAYMLMYRQRNPERNTNFFTTEDLPQHIKDLVQKIASEEEAFKEAKEQERYMCKIKLFYENPLFDKPMERALKVNCESTLKETTQLALEILDIDAPLDRCRLVKYDDITETIESFTEGPNEMIHVCLGGIKSSYKFSLLLELRKEDQIFEKYLPGDTLVKMHIVHLDTGEVDPATQFRVNYNMTVKEFKEFLGRMMSVDPLKLTLVHQYLADWKPIEKDGCSLKHENISRSNTIFVECSGCDGVGFRQGSRMHKILDRFEDTITIYCDIPTIDEEVLKEFQISRYEPIAVNGCESEASQLPSSSPSTNLSVTSESTISTSVTSTNSTEVPISSRSTKSSMSSTLNAVLTAPVIVGASQSPTVANFSDEDEGIVDSDPTISTVNSDQSASEDSSLTSDSDRTLVGEQADDAVWSPSEHPGESSPEEQNSKDKDISSFVWDLRDATAALEDDTAEDHSLLKSSKKRYFKVREKTANTLVIDVDKEITIGQMKEELQPFVGVSLDHFKLFKLFSTREEYECARDLETLHSYPNNTVMNVRLCKALLPGQFRVKVFTIDFDSHDNPSKFLQSFVISSGDTVAEVKESLVKEINERTDMNLIFKDVRLRKKFWKNPQTIYLNSQIFDRDIPVHPNWEMYLQVLGGPEIKQDDEQICMFAKRWRPSSYTTDPLVEFMVPEKTVASLKEKLSCLSGIPTDNLLFVKGSGAFPCDMSVINIEQDLDWSEKDGDLDRSVGIIDDGCVIYYKDKMESLKELSDREKSQLQTSENTRLNIESPYLVSEISSSRYKEKGLKIYFNQT